MLSWRGFNREGYFHPRPSAVRHPIAFEGERAGEAKGVIAELPAMLRIARQTVAQYAPADVFALVEGLYDSEVVQVRMLAAVLAGELAAGHDGARAFLNRHVDLEQNSRVRQAILLALAPNS